MREIRTSGSMSGEGKRGVAVYAQATAPLLDSTHDTALCETEDLLRHGAGLVIPEKRIAG